ncbi:MAG: hypothetical protein C0504_01740 [Candidatus Solibacter sp.]|nr:hypothetical protein [Candidatus Solibacter sp.]
MKKLAAVLAVLLFAVAVFRAWTQSITHDEAYTWRLFIASPFSSILNTYDANHHILHTWLVRLSTSIAGVSEFTLRLPALAGAALYLWTLTRLSTRLFAHSWLAPASVILLGASPLVMDFQVAARGYGLALAFFFFAFDRLLAVLGGDLERKTLWTAGAALGLSIASNLVFVIPVALLAALFLSLWTPPAPAPARKIKKKRVETPAKPLARRTDLLIAFAAVMVLLFFMSPVKKMLKPGLYYVGQPTLALSLADLADTTLGHNEGIREFNAPIDGNEPLKHAFGYGVYPAVLLLGAVLGWQRRTTAPHILIAAAVALGAWFAVSVMHVALGTPFPTDRTGIYHFPLFALVLLGLAASSVMALRIAAGTLAAALMLSFALQLQVNYFRMWRFDAETRRLAVELNQRGLKQGKPVTTGISWLLRPAVDFYQATLGARGFEYALPHKMRPGLDVYLLTSDDYPLIDNYNLRTTRALSIPQILMAEPKP